MNIENIEKVVLSSILFNSETIEEIGLIISENDFYLPLHKKIYSLMQKLHKKSMPIDEEFIIKYDNSKQVQDILIDILSITPVSDPIAYAKEIKEISAKKQIDMLSIKIKQMTSDEDTKSSEILNFIENEYEALASRNNYNFLNESSIAEIKAEDTNFICKKYVPLPEHAVTLISARGGTGKTFVAIKIADEAIKENPDYKVLIVASEDRKGKIKARAEKLNISNPNIFISDVTPFDVLEKDYKTQNWKPTEEFYKFKKEISKYDLIIIDPLISFYSGKENDNGDAKKFMLQFTNFCSKMNKTIVFLHHAGKNDTGTRGAGAFADASRLAYFVTKDYTKDGDGIKELKNEKLRFEIEKENDNIKSVKNIDPLKKVADIGSFAVEVFPTFVEIQFVNETKKEKNYTPGFGDINSIDFVDAT